MLAVGILVVIAGLRVKENNEAEENLNLE